MHGSVLLCAISVISCNATNTLFHWYVGGVQCSVKPISHCTHKQYVKANLTVYSTAQQN